VKAEAARCGVLARRRQGDGFFVFGFFFFFLPVKI
jgi:hypothetical protein